MKSLSKKWSGKSSSALSLPAPHRALLLGWEPVGFAGEAQQESVAKDKAKLETQLAQVAQARREPIFFLPADLEFEAQVF